MIHQPEGTRRGGTGSFIGHTSCGGDGEGGSDGRACDDGDQHVAS
ncbi:hypothetical protein [Thioclava sp. GXIMD4216]